MEYKGKTFERETIRIDGNTYLDCQFTNCTLLYGGGPAPSLQHNAFTDCEWTLDGHAALTLDFLNRLYKSGAVNLVESVFHFIKNAKPLDNPAKQPAHE